MLKNLAITTILLTTASCAFEQKPAPYVQKGDEVYTRSASNSYMPSSGRQSTQVSTSFGSSDVQSYDLAPTNSYNTYSRNDGVIDFSNQQQNTYQTSQLGSAPVSRPIVSDYIDAPSSASASGEYGFATNNTNSYSSNNSYQPATNSYQPTTFAQPARPVLDEPSSQAGYKDESIDFVQQKPAAGNPNTSRSDYLDLGAVNNFNGSQAAAPSLAPAPSKLGSISVASKPEYSQPVEVSQAPAAPIENNEIQPVETNDNSGFISVPPLQEVASVAPTKALEPIEPAAQPVEAPAPAAKDSQENEIENSAIIRSSTPITTEKMFIRPIAGEIIGKFGNEKDGTFNDGIQIKAAKGTDVKAADGGEVVYSGNQLQGYGNMIIIRHASGYLTSYAHLEGLDIKKGTKVGKGDIIGKVGDTGNVSEPQLHFGVREGREPVDPQKFL